MNIRVLLGPDLRGSADRISTASDRVNSLQDTASTLAEDAQVFAEADPGNVIAKISRFEENCDIVLKALAVVKQAHPFINGTRSSWLSR